MARTDRWQMKEVLGNQYLYVSKNGNDTLAANHFGKAAAWVANESIAINERRVSSSIQYRNKTGTNTATAPASDSTNWEFDKDNFQTYVTTQVYNIGNKTVFNNEHYICLVNGSTNTFQPNNWAKVVVSNKDFPYLYMNTAIVLANTDARFVSYELFDYPNNKAYHKIHIMISNGVWSETLTAPTKYMRFIGQSKWKCLLDCKSTNSLFNIAMLDSLSIINWGYGNVRFNNVILKNISNGYITYSNHGIYFCYKNIFYSSLPTTDSTYFKHIVNCVFLNSGVFSPQSTTYIYDSNTIIRNNYFNGTVYFGLTTNIRTGNFDYNRFAGTVYINNVAKTDYTTLTAATSNQNINSAFISSSAVTFNNDYTLPSNSPLLSTGYGGVNIGAENRGYNYTISTLLNSDSGATYRNITKSGTILVREQVNKFPQTATSSNITLQSDASSVNETYTGFRIKILDGLGINQTRLITAYDGSTKIATIGSYSGSSATWDVTPDQYSIYEILDGEVISAIGDIGSVKIIKNLNILTTNIYDAFGKYQQIVSTSNVDDYPDSLDFELKSGLANDLAGSLFRKFKQDDYLRIDTSGRPSADSNFDADAISTDALPMRYFQIKVQFHKN